ncbi:MAG: hypothetical protein ACOYK8_07540 [Alphaproteobacteria bacterium]
MVEEDRAVDDVQPPKITAYQKAEEYFLWTSLLTGVSGIGTVGIGSISQAINKNLKNNFTNSPTYKFAKACNQRLDNFHNQVPFAADLLSEPSCTATEVEAVRYEAKLNQAGADADGLVYLGIHMVAVPLGLTLLYVIAKTAAMAGKKQAVKDVQKQIGPKP